MTNGVAQPGRTRPLAEALDEVYRELAVRSRCFPRWVDEGRVSRTDAADRYDRLHAAWVALGAMVEAQQPVVTKTGDTTDRPF